MNAKELDAFADRVRADLLAERNERGHWEGRLSDSALATAVALVALLWAKRKNVAPPEADRLVSGGLSWLADHRNEDGGWGDCPESPSNVSTVTLCWSALSLAEEEGFSFPGALRSAEAWLERDVGSLEPARLAATLYERYGKDRTFAVPILTLCACCGTLGKGEAAWRLVKPLPFELATLPHGFFKSLNLHVVSYALPALIAIGYARHRHLPSRNPLARFARAWAKPRVLKLLRGIQPAGGGYLEATPLTAFVTMSLTASGEERHPVVAEALRFIVGQARGNGSWPIDANLATWVTTLSVNALGASGELPLPEEEAGSVRNWLLAQQWRTEHPYTRAEPGGWAWTDLSGGVPDADDTPGALLALKKLGCSDLSSVEAAVRWLLDLQNADGGMPTFCRGWGKLPFDQSSPDLTIHALRAWAAWADDLPALRSRLLAASRRALDFLARAQRPDGTWTPLWFGNQHVPEQENPLYGTARVLTGLAELPAGFSDQAASLGKPALARLLDAQNPDGSWGGAKGAPGSLEETALALDALASLQSQNKRSQIPSNLDPPSEQSAAPSPRSQIPSNLDPAEEASRTSGPKTRLSGYVELSDNDKERLEQALASGLRFAKSFVDERGYEATPIGLYFAKLWYHEKLYPKTYLLAALEKIRARST